MKFRLPSDEAGVFLSEMKSQALTGVLGWIVLS